MSEQLGIGFEAPEAPRTSALRHHHVRAHETAEEALAGERAAAGQEVEVLRWWRVQDGRRPGVRFSPSEVWKAVGEPRSWPLTSVRRALTNLTNEAEPPILVHHPEDKRPGLFGRGEGTWSLAPEPAR